MNSENDALAGVSGQDSNIKEPIEAYDAKHGTYECPVAGKNPIPTAQSIDKAPLTGLKKG